MITSDKEGEGKPSRLPRGNLKSRFGANMLAAVYGQAVSVFVQFGPIPFAISAWGAERFGTWLVLSGVFAFVTVFEASVGIAHQRRLIHAWAANSTEKAAVVSAAVVTNALLVCLCLTLTLITVGIIKATEQTPGSRTAFAILFFLLGANSAIGIVINGLLMPLKVAGRFAYVAVAQHSLRGAEAAIMCFGAASGGQETHIAGAMVFSKLLYLPRAVVLFRQSSGPWTRTFPSGCIDRGLVKEIGSALLQPAYLAISIQGVIQAVAVSLGAAHAATVGVLRAVSRAPLQACIPILSPVLIEYTIANSRADRVSIKRLLVKTTFLTAGASISLSLLLWAFSEPLLTYLGRAKLAYTSVDLMIFLLASVTSACSLCLGQFLLGVNRFQYMGLIGLGLSLCLLLVIGTGLVVNSITAVAVSCLIFEVLLLLLSVSQAFKAYGEAG